MKNLTRTQYILKNLWPLAAFLLVLLGLLIYWALTVQYASELWAYIGTIVAILAILFFSIRHYSRKYDRM